MAARKKSGLTGEVRRVEDLAARDRDALFALLLEYFENVTRGRFERDLAEKEWVVLLTDAATGSVRGFSTLMRLDVRVGEAGEPVTGFFSGDTIVAREYWGESTLSRLWARHAFSLADEVRTRGEAERVYWFLISSGYKTYRFLPTFFRDYYPHYEKAMPPAVKQTLDAFGRLKYPDEYDPTTGVVRPKSAVPLRPGVADLDARRLADPRVAFFAARNPGHAMGDELACLAELVPENLTPAGHRMLGASDAQPRTLRKEEHRGQ